MNARLALILLFGFVAFINCADIYLSPFGSDSNSGSSTSSPLKSFNQALQIASSGDVIYAMPGLYSGTLNSDITISKSVTITSTEGPDSTIVIGPGGWDVRTQCTISDLQFVSFTNGEVFYVYLTSKYTDTAVTFNNVIFYENDWAIYFYDYYYANTHAIYNCNFTANTQAVLFNQYYSYSTLNVENCTFDNNTRAINGLFNELSVSNSYFSQMSCTAPGCAISVNASTSTAITGNIFSECVSSSNGGAIYIAKGTSGTTISSCKFISNSGVSGGAIYSLGSVDIVSSIFQTNTATVGGSLYLLGSTSTSVGSSIADTSFLLNSATDSAGAVYCQSSSISFQDVDFYSNKAPVGSSYQCGSGCYTFEIDVKSQNNSPDCSTTV